MGPNKARLCQATKGTKISCCENFLPESIQCCFSCKLVAYKNYIQFRSSCVEMLLKKAFKEFSRKHLQRSPSFKEAVGLGLQL